MISSSDLHQLYCHAESEDGLFKKLYKSDKLLWAPTKFVTLSDEIETGFTLLATNLPRAARKVSDV